MKTLNSYINERLVLTKNKSKIKRTLIPKTTDELQSIIVDEIKNNGPESSLNHIDTSHITDMSDLFCGKDKFIVSGGLDETSNILKSFNGDISNWDVSNVTNMSSMFNNSKFTGENSDISGWDVSNVTDMPYMFCNAKFNGDISTWDVSKVEDMQDMFIGSEFNGDISNWNVSNVEIMAYMFARSKFNGDISNWNVSNCQHMENMFQTSIFNQDISKWNVLNVTNYYKIFNGCPIKKKYKPAKFK